MLDMLQRAKKDNQNIQIKDLKTGPAIQIQMGKKGCSVSELLEFIYSFVAEVNTAKPSSEGNNVINYLQAAATRQKKVKV